MRFIAVEVGTFADGKNTKSYQVFEMQEDGVYAPVTSRPNDPVTLGKAKVRVLRYTTETKKLRPELNLLSYMIEADREDIERNTKEKVSEAKEKAEKTFLQAIYGYALAAARYGIEAATKSFEDLFPTYLKKFGEEYRKEGVRQERAATIQWLERLSSGAEEVPRAELWQHVTATVKSGGHLAKEPGPEDLLSSVEYVNVASGGVTLNIELRQDLMESQEEFLLRAQPKLSSILHEVLNSPATKETKEQVRVRVLVLLKMWFLVGQLVHLPNGKWRLLNKETPCSSTWHDNNHTTPEACPSCDEADGWKP